MLAMNLRLTEDEQVPGHKPSNWKDRKKEEEIVLLKKDETMDTRRYTHVLLRCDISLN